MLNDEGERLHEWVCNIIEGGRWGETLFSRYVLLAAVFTTILETRSFSFRGERDASQQSTLVYTAHTTVCLRPFDGNVEWGNVARTSR